MVKIRCREMRCVFSEKMEFDNVKYSAGWFAKKFPGFYNEECYRILEAYFKENRPHTLFEDTFENKNIEITSRKRKHSESDISDYGVEESKDDARPQLLETLSEDCADIERVLHEHQTFPDLQPVREYEGTGGQRGDAELEQDHDEPTGSDVRRDGAQGDGGVYEYSERSTEIHSES